MPSKISPDLSYGEKLVSLFARLVFTGEWRSLTDLSRELGCSKQTVLRLVDDITHSYGARIEHEMQGNRSFYRIRRALTPHPAAMLTSGELDTLLMCRAFTEHLLGRRHFAELNRAVEKSSQLLMDDADLNTQRFGIFRAGVIDYTPQQEILHTLMEAMNRRKVCEVSYRKPGATRAKTFRIKPLKIFAWNETLYVHARYAKMPGRPFKDPGYDPLLALQRFRRAGITDTPFRRPKNYDFEKSLNRHFGLIQGKSFKVAVRLKGWAADYAAERIWSPNQEVRWNKDGSVRITFSAVSMPETVSWVLRFGEMAKILRPRELKDAVRTRIEEVERLYGW